MSKTLEYLEDEGIPTQTCMGPYVNRSWQECENTCIASKTYVESQSVKCKKGTKYQHIGIESIKQDLYKNGPVASQMVVYEDLISYQSGVYGH